MSFWLPYSLLSSHTINLRNRINEERRQNRAKDIRIAELQREVELLEQRANDQAAELEALRASNKKQGRLIRAIRPLSRGRGCRILGHVIGGELGPGKFLMGDGHSLPSSPPSHDFTDLLQALSFGPFFFSNFFTSCISVESPKKELKQKRPRKNC